MSDTPPIEYDFPDIRRWEKGDAPLVTVAIVTCAASGWMSETHHREPVRLSPEDWAKWLGEEGHGAATLMRAAPEGSYARWRVDPRVNSNRAEGENLIEPLAA